jgi:ABC-2 type transport system permease protein
MSTTIRHTLYMTARQLRIFARQPMYIAFTLFQPMIYLFLFSALFQRVADIPGFGGGSYISFLTPGIVVMSAVFGGGWAGMGIIEDIDRGVIDRFLVTPSSRLAIVAGRVLSLGLITTIQSVVIVGIGLAIGAQYPGGLAGLLVLFLSSILLAAPFGALSCGLALVARKEESVIAAVNFVTLPLTFLASIFMANQLMPDWMQVIASLNPVNWAIEAARQALSFSPDWAIVVSRLGLLLLFGIACSWLATRAFRSYQQSI